MPELPEVETVARQLAPVLTGKVIRSVSVSDPRLRLGHGLGLNTRNLRGWMIAGVVRCGKQVVLELMKAGGRCRWLAIHLRMTGRLQYSPGKAPSPARRRLLLRLDAGALAFYDLRRFGTVELHRDLSGFTPPGLDPLSPRFTAIRLAELIGDSAQEIKSWLLRQDRLVGLGNIYACETLFRAGINPLRPAGGLSPDEISALARAVRSVLHAAIKNCGTTFSDFQDSQGRIGGYQRYLKVYGREGLPCLRCGELVERRIQQQRSTFFCPACQR